MSKAITEYSIRLSNGIQTVPDTDKQGTFERLETQYGWDPSAIVVERTISAWVPASREPKRSADDILRDVFSAFDGDASVSFEFGRSRRGDGSDGGPLTIGGILSFMSEWDTIPEPPFIGLAWADMTPEQRFERSKWSAQHALVKRLADLKAEFEGIGL